MRKNISLIVTMFFFLNLSPLAYSAEVVKQGSNGSVNWSKGIVYAEGFGTAKAGLPSAQRRLLSRRAAIVDGQRNLLEMTKGVRITSVTKVVDAMLDSSVTASKVEGVIKGAAPIKESYLDDIYTVTMAMPIGGELLSVVYVPPQFSHFSQEKSAWQLLDKSIVALESFLIPRVSASEPYLIEGDSDAHAARKIIKWINTQKPANVVGGLQSALEQFEQGTFSGLLIDASQVPGFELATIPQIRDEEGNVIYPNASTSYSDIVNKRGVTYDFDLEDAVLNKRVSDIPLIVNALSTYQNLTSDLVINKSDASRIMGSASIRSAMKKAGVLIVVAI